MELRQIRLPDDLLPLGEMIGKASSTRRTRSGAYRRTRKCTSPIMSGACAGCGRSFASFSYSPRRCATCTGGTSPLRMGESSESPWRGAAANQQDIPPTW